MPEIKFKSAFELGEIVYLKTDDYGWERQVVGIVYRPNGLLYELRSAADEASLHTYLEILKEKEKRTDLKVRDD
jgi:hypothetical protein